MPDPRSIEVYAALRAYCERALEVVAANYEEQDDRYRVAEHWREGPENVFRRVVLEELDPWAPISPNTHTLQGLAEHEAAINALRSDEVFTPQLDTLVGTTMATHRVEPEAILHGLLGKVIAPGFDLDEGRFDDAYAELEETFYRTTIPVTVIMPLRGLLLEAPHVELEPNLEVDYLKEHELSACLELGLLQGPMDTSADVVTLDANSRAGIRQSIELEKIVGEDRLGSGTLHEDINASFERTIAALRLLKPGDVSPTSRVMLSDYWFVRRRSMTPRAHPPRTWPGELALLRDDEGDLLHLYIALRGEPESLHRGLDLAVRRFSAAADRTLPEDKILDTMIAAEALFLNDVGRDRAELGYRLSLRAAFLLGEEASDRRSIQKFMRDAYRVRSRISHGDEVSTAKAMDGSTVDLRLFARELQETMRSATATVLRRVAATGSRIDWDALVMGSGDPSNS